MRAAPTCWLIVAVALAVADRAVCQSFERPASARSPIAQAAQDEDDAAALLSRFRAEFLPIEPGRDAFDPMAYLHEQGSTTVDTESPRRVELTYAFQIGKYEVTQALWEEVMGSNPSRWQGERNSVEQLDFDEAVEFCRRVTELLRQADLIEADEIVRLPTEVEWEYACRAGTTTLFSCGDQTDQLDAVAWYTENAAGNDPEVGEKESNPWGLYDVHGYLWEWCISELDDPYQPTQPGVNWHQDYSGDRAALRGGSWKDPAERLASGYRWVSTRALKDDAVGLRCVLCAVPAVDEDSAQPVADEFEPTRQAAIVRADSELELLWNDGDFTEGPAVAPDGIVLFSDIGDRIMRFDPANQDVDVFRDPSGRSNGLIFDRDGNLLTCEGANTGGGRRISKTDPSGRVVTLADSYQGARFNSPNDLALDGQGNLYFSDPRYVGDEPRELDYEAVFRVTPSGEVSIATNELTKPNGLLISIDGKSAYVAEHHPTGNKHLVRFDISADGTFVDPVVLHDFGTGRGIDGMAMDSDGNLYATAGADDQSGVYVFGPNGEHLAMIPLPGNPTNCCFGVGDTASTLYITAAGPLPEDPNQARRYGLYRIVLHAEGLRR